ncbi:Anaphase-promoting complex subunit 10 [Thelotrema lepadinum]|nr:Anaphase-promoting complex subunit 10 [Thelotrema lepadinum]
MATPSTPSTLPAPSDPSSSSNDAPRHPQQPTHHYHNNHPDTQAPPFQPGAQQTPASPGASTTSLPPSSRSPSRSPSPTTSNPLPTPSPSLREISSLASWTVSTYKPGCGIKELLSPSTASFWQSDGPQPHLLTIHFFKVVSIVRLRVYLDFELDESYTPTRMVFAAGMGEYDLVEFAEWRGESPRGWVEVGLEGAGGREGTGYGIGRIEGGYGIGSGYGDEDGVEGLELGEGMDEYLGSAVGEGLVGGEEDEDDGGVLRCMCVQIRIMENHQNGKDTHVRGVQLFARDERVKRRKRRGVPSAQAERGRGAGSGDVEEAMAVAEEEAREDEGMMGLMEADWMGEPEIR